MSLKASRCMPLSCQSLPCCTAHHIRVAMSVAAARRTYRRQQRVVSPVSGCHSEYRGSPGQSHTTCRGRRIPQPAISSGSLPGSLSLQQALLDGAGRENGSFGGSECQSRCQCWLGNPGCGPRSCHDGSRGTRHTSRFINGCFNAACRV